MDKKTEGEYEGNEVVDERGFNFFMVNNSLEDIEHLDNGITKPSEIAVFCAIAFHADSKTRKAFPSIKKVAKEARVGERSEEHTSELQSRFDLVCRLLLEKKKNTYKQGRSRYVNSAKNSLKH